VIASRKPTVTTWNPVNQATVRKKPTVTTYTRTPRIGRQ